MEQTTAMYMYMQASDDDTESLVDLIDTCTTNNLQYTHTHTHTHTQTCTSQALDIHRGSTYLVEYNGSIMNRKKYLSLVQTMWGK